MIAMHALNLGCERDQRDEFRPVGVVVACPDVIDQIDRSVRCFRRGSVDEALQFSNQGFR